MSENETKPPETDTAPGGMPIRAEPYKHQIDAFEFAMKLFGIEGGDEKDVSKE